MPAGAAAVPAVPVTPARPPGNAAGHGGAQRGRRGPRWGPDIGRAVCDPRAPSVPAPSALGSRLPPAPSPDPAPRSQHGRARPGPAALGRPSGSPRPSGWALCSLFGERAGAAGPCRSACSGRGLWTGESFCYSLNSGLLLSAARISNSSWK